MLCCGSLLECVASLGPVHCWISSQYTLVATACVARGDASAPARPRATGLLAALNSFRGKEARRRRWKPYQVLTNDAIQRILAARPITSGDLLAIHGIGDAKVAKFGDAILDLVQEFKT